MTKYLLIVLLLASVQVARAADLVVAPNIQQTHATNNYIHVAPTKHSQSISDPPVQNPITAVQNAHSAANVVYQNASAQIQSAQTTTNQQLQQNAANVINQLKGVYGGDALTQQILQQLGQTQLLNNLNLTNAMHEGAHQPLSSLPVTANSISGQMPSNLPVQLTSAPITIALPMQTQVRTILEQLPKQ